MTCMRLNVLWSAFGASREQPEPIRLQDEGQEYINAR